MIFLENICFLFRIVYLVRVILENLIVIYCLRNCTDLIKYVYCEIIAFVSTKFGDFLKKKTHTQKISIGLLFPSISILVWLLLRFVLSSLTLGFVVWLAHEIHENKCPGKIYSFRLVGCRIECRYSGQIKWF